MRTSKSKQSADHDASVTIPILEETAFVDTRVTEVGSVRVRKVVEQREQVIDEPSMREHVRVERRLVNRVVETVPELRQEGETWIVPLVEEEVVLQKRLVLKEELLITRTREEIHEPEKVVLRSERAIVERAEKKEGPEAEREAGG